MIEPATALLSPDQSAAAVPPCDPFADGPMPALGPMPAMPCPWAVAEVQAAARVGPQLDLTKPERKAVDPLFAFVEDVHDESINTIADAIAEAARLDLDGDTKGRDKAMRVALAIARIVEAADRELIRQAAEADLGAEDDDQGEDDAVIS